MLYDDINEVDNRLDNHLELLQSRLGTSQYDHDTMLDTLIGLRNIAWSINNHRMVDHIRQCLALYNQQ